MPDDPPAPDQVGNLAIHIAIHETFAHDPPSVLCLLPQDKRNAAPEQNSNNIARPCATRCHTNIALFSDHQPTCFLPHSIVKAREKGIELIVHLVHGVGRRSMECWGWRCELGGYLLHQIL